MTNMEDDQHPRVPVLETRQKERIGVNPVWDGALVEFKFV